MKRDEYIERALRSGYKMKDLDYLTTYEVSKLPAKYDKSVVQARSAYAPRYRVTSDSANKLTPSEEVALKKYFKK
jgi:lipocalin